MVQLLPHNQPLFLLSSFSFSSVYSFALSFCLLLFVFVPDSGSRTWFFLCQEIAECELNTRKLLIDSRALHKYHVQMFGYLNVMFLLGVVTFSSIYRVLPSAGVMPAHYNMLMMKCNTWPTTPPPVSVPVCPFLRLEPAVSEGN